MPRPERLELLRTNPLIEITLLHRAMRLELEAMCEATRALAAAPANDGAALAALRRRSARSTRSSRATRRRRTTSSFRARGLRGARRGEPRGGEHIDEVALVDGAAAALDAAAARGRCDGATVAALQDLKEKLADHMDHEEGEIFPLLAEIPERELKRMAGLVLGARPADVLELTIRLQVQHLEPALARHVLGTMCEVARGTRFRRWLDRALGAAAARRRRRPRRRRHRPRRRHRRHRRRRGGGARATGTSRASPRRAAASSCAAAGATTRGRAPATAPWTRAP